MSITETLPCRTRRRPFPFGFASRHEHAMHRQRQDEADADAMLAESARRLGLGAVAALNEQED